VLPRAAAGAAVGSLRVASNYGEPYSEASFANELGYFRSLNLDVDLSIIGQGGTMAAAVAAGTLDIAIATPVQVASAFSRNIPFIIIAAGAVSTIKAPVTPVVVAAGSALRQPHDLAGKTIALNGLRASSELALDAWLAQSNVDVSQIHPIEMSFNEMGEALKRGTVDAAVIGEPAMSAALKNGDVRVLGNPYAAIAPNCLTSCWFTTIQFARANNDLIKRFTTAIYQAGLWANTHHDDSAAMLAKLAKLDLSTIRTMTRTQYADSLRVSDLQPLLDVALKFGYLQRAVAATDVMFHA
jgi:NitT/TauT family transport system substrate-binding protein